MKLLVLLIVIFAVIWLARGGRGRVAHKPPAPPRVPLPEDMVACAECGLLLPRSEALPGRGGVFCTAAHRDAFEHAHP